MGFREKGQISLGSLSPERENSGIPGISAMNRVVQGVVCLLVYPGGVLMENKTC